MNWIEIFERPKLDQLLANHREQQPLKGTRAEKDYQPVCKLFLPWAAGTWLLTECAPDGLAFGLCDLALGQPELGLVDLEELAGVRGPGGLRVEQDLFWTAEHPLSWYADKARADGYIKA